MQSFAICDPQYEISNLDRLKGFLEDWAVWTAGYRPNLGASGMRMQTCGGHDFESLFADTDKRTMKVIDTCIDDLTPAQTAAIHRRYLHIDWRFPRDNYAVMLDQAHDRLVIVLQKKDILV